MLLNSEHCWGKRRVDSQRPHLMNEWMLSFQPDTYVVPFHTVSFAHSNFISFPNLWPPPTPTVSSPPPHPPRRLSSPSPQTSSLGWSTSTCTAPTAPCTDLSTTRCPTLTSATSSRAKSPWTRCTSATPSRCAGGRSVSVHYETKFSV